MAWTRQGTSAIPQDTPGRPATVYTQWRNDETGQEILLPEGQSPPVGDAAPSGAVPRDFGRSSTPVEREQQQRAKDVQAAQEKRLGRERAQRIAENRGVVVEFEGERFTPKSLQSQQQAVFQPPSNVKGSPAATPQARFAQDGFVQVAPEKQRPKSVLQNVLSHLPRFDVRSPQETVRVQKDFLKPEPRTKSEIRANLTPPPTFFLERGGTKAPEMFEIKPFPDSKAEAVLEKFRSTPFEQEQRGAAFIGLTQLQSKRETVEPAAFAAKTAELQSKASTPFFQEKLNPARILIAPFSAGAGLFSLGKTTVTQGPGAGAKQVGSGITGLPQDFVHDPLLTVAEVLVSGRILRGPSRAAGRIASRFTEPVLRPVAERTGRPRVEISRAETIRDITSPKIFAELTEVTGKIFQPKFPSIIRKPEVFGIKLVEKGLTKPAPAADRIPTYRTRGTVTGQIFGKGGKAQLGITGETFTITKAVKPDVIAAGRLGSTAVLEKGKPSGFGIKTEQLISGVRVAKFGKREIFEFETISPRPKVSKIRRGGSLPPFTAGELPSLNVLDFAKKGVLRRSRAKTVKVAEGAVPEAVTYETPYGPITRTFPRKVQLFKGYEAGISGKRAAGQGILARQDLKRQSTQQQRALMNFGQLAKQATLYQRSRKAAPEKLPFKFRSRRISGHPLAPTAPFGFKQPTQPTNQAWQGLNLQQPDFALEFAPVTRRASAPSSQAGLVGELRGIAAEFGKRRAYETARTASQRVGQGTKQIFRTGTALGLRSQQRQQQTLFTRQSSGLAEPIGTRSKIHPALISQSKTDTLIGVVPKIRTALYPPLQKTKTALFPALRQKLTPPGLVPPPTPFGPATPGGTFFAPFPFKPKLLQTFGKRSRKARAPRAVTSSIIGRLFGKSVSFKRAQKTGFTGLEIRPFIKGRGIRL